jgi:DNA polymerase type B, organellar and viral
MPMQINCDQYELFETQNNVSLNVFTFAENNNPTKKIDRYDIIQIYRTTKPELIPINLMVYSAEDCHIDQEDLNQFHYCYIQDINMLYRSTVTTFSKKIQLCLKCSKRFNCMQRYETHLKLCGLTEIPTFPSEHYISFKNYYKTQRQAFAIYSDFECYLKKVDSCSNNPSTSYTEPYQEHIPFCYSYYVKNDIRPNKHHIVQYIHNENESDISIGKHFLLDIEKTCKRLIDSIKIKEMTDVDLDQFHKAKLCIICNRPFIGGDAKVKDHCHYTGFYRGAAHNTCNLNNQKRYFVPVFIHNMARYDAHLFIRELGYNKQNISIIAKSRETVTAITKYAKSYNNRRFKIVYLDSFQFLSCSLDNLAKSLKEFPVTQHFYPNTEQFILLNQKLSFPYDNLCSFESLNDPIPPREQFYNRLEDVELSEIKYQHVLNICKEFNIKTMRDYVLLYVKIDILLFADVFENFRTSCLKNYYLDPVHYFSTPGLTFDAALRYTQIKLEIIKDYEMVQFIEKGTRGGLTQIGGLRYIKANNKYMGDQYDLNQPSSFIVYLDMNNMYGYAMSQPLPVGDFVFQTDCTNFDLNQNLAVEKGYIAEVDITYPNTLEWHNYYSDLPLCAEKKTIGKCQKLVCDLLPKKHYVVHHRMLKFLLQQGVIIKKIHRVLHFTERAWLKSYINFNTQKRIESRGNKFLEDFFKLMNNSLFGKTIENVKLYKNCKLVCNMKSAKKYTSKPTLEEKVILNDNLILFIHKRDTIVFSKPTYSGMSILDISKMYLYEFYYNHLKPFYKDNIVMAYGDTDSAVTYITTNDVYMDFKNQFFDLLDTSNYPNDHMLFSLTNERVLGKMKDETAGVIITECIALRPKLYSFKLLDENESTKAKGIKRSAMKHIKFKNLYSHLFDENENDEQDNMQYAQFNKIQSKNHILNSVSVSKKALDYHDDKRHYIDKIRSLPYGHILLETIDNSLN